MKSRTLYVGSAVAGAIGGTGIVLLDLAQIFDEVPRQTVGLIEIPITAFLLLALPGVYLWQSAKAGVLGLTGFVLTFVGVALGMGHFYLMAFARSVLTEWPDAANAVGNAARVVAPFELLTFVGGWILFGIATYRARIFPRPAAAMLVIGVALVMIRPLLPVQGPVGGALIGTAFLWLSITLLREARDAA
jgi:hypothetical protein